ncbi:MAG: hypothetical protein ACREJB_03225 [Planctomycetaceae bacterium]
MTKIVIDAALPEKLHQIQERVQLCTEDGRIVGVFLPVVDKSLYERIEPPISEEELDRREKQGGGRSLQEILRDLEGSA